MSNFSSVIVSVPATTANIGPGFDCLGAALSLYNRFIFSSVEAEPGTVSITALGDEADRVQLDADNLVYRAFVHLYQELNQPVPAVQVEIQLGVPLARGLGSSATAIVGGLVGANALLDFPLNRQAVMQMAIALEGHPDNVVPALVGGCCLAATDSNLAWEICDIPWSDRIAPVVAIPDFELSTTEARRVLPATYSRADAIFNTAHLGLLVRGLEMGNPAWLQAALQDRIHQPYRQALIPGYGAVQVAAIAAGAYGLVISGAGPTLLALAAIDNADNVRDAIAQAWSQENTKAVVKVLKLDRAGASVQML
ncbi:MAG: homoserine kinase [Oscillatoriales cyanobacterium C42_A2020_001]|nr:homoserine kinase [Leptolyngbyaceae cyanobacterium C42_A2020_001]